jgi:hypothetical protein
MALCQSLADDIGRLFPQSECTVELGDADEPCVDAGLFPGAELIEEALYAHACEIGKGALP